MAVRLDMSRWFICDWEKKARLNYAERYPEKSFREVSDLFAALPPEKCTKYWNWGMNVSMCESCKRERGLK